MTLSVFITVISGHDKPQPSGCLLDFFSDSSEKKTGNFYFQKQADNYSCPVRGSIPSYKLMQATNNIPEDITFKAYYLPYKKNNVTSLSLELNSDFNYFFTDILDGCSVGIRT
ncbi:hypothetical protein OHF33_22465 [Escherichia coli]|nr:hypothetical protein [Escherichia coli]MCV3064619.1 hypothetical protein [Escherichia coli]